MRRVVTVVDYGRSNLLSVQRALEHCGAEVRFAKSAAELDGARFLVLPGVGAFADGIAALNAAHMTEPLRRLARDGVPLLGICLGMQLLFDWGEEGGRTEGLGLLAGGVVPLPARTAAGETLKAPHIGWSALELSGAAPGSIREALSRGGEVYFVHGYHARPADARDTVAEIVYGGHALCAAVRRENVAGFQFHPEKSGETGLALLRAVLSAGG